jgi:uncharacterized damage-inducible protein DinB
MTVEEIRRLFGYASWADDLMFRSLEQLSEEQFLAPAASSFPSIGATLAHMVSADWIWLERWRGSSPTAAPAWIAEPRLDDLRARRAGIEAERERFLSGLSDGDLLRPVSYRTLRGHANTDALGELMWHAVNHTTYHRGQLATQLRQFGITPPSTDMIVYMRRAR